LTASAPDFRFEAEIARPADAVFALVSAVERETDWHGEVLAISPLTTGPPRIGSRFVRRRKTPIGPLDFTIEVRKLDRGSRLYEEEIVDTDMRGTRLRWTVSVKRGGSVAAIELFIEVSGMWGMFKPMVLQRSEKELKESIAGLKRFLETEQVPGDP
jgi:uncharacterized protein YndB with AHSA1/START domain